MVVELVKENDLVDLYFNEHKAFVDSVLNDYKSVTEFAWGTFCKKTMDLNRSEAWRYFPFNKLIKTIKEYSSFEAPTKIVDVSDASSTLADNTILITNGCLDQMGPLDASVEVSQVRYADQKMTDFFDHFFKHEKESSQNPLVFLNGSLSHSAILIKTDTAKANSTPTVVIDLLSNEPGISWPMIGFEVSSKASLNVEIHVNGEDAKSLLIANLFAKVQSQGQLTIDYVQCDNQSKGILFQNRIIVEEAASLTLNGFCSGGQLNRVDTEILMTHENSHADVNFLTMTRESRQQHHFINMIHAAPTGESSQLFRNLLFDKGVVSVDGTVFVKEGAFQTNSSQLINNLFFSEEAKANTKPNLSILNDDVKCNHGATFGQLEEESLFYLKSRGLSEEQAIAILTKSFATEVVEKFHSNMVKDKINKILGR